MWDIQLIAAVLAVSAGAGFLAGLLGIGGGMVMVPVTLFGGLSMVVQIPFWSFKEINIRRKVPFFALILAVLGLLVVTWQPSVVLFGFFLAYSVSGYVHYAWRWLKKRRQRAARADDSGAA